MEQPQAGSPQESQSTPPAPYQEETIFHESDYSMEGYDKHIRNARNMLFIVAAIELVLGIFTSIKEEGMTRSISIGITIFIALIFAGLALWTKQKPFAALVTALIIYVALLILDAVFDVSSLYKGIVLKIGIIVSLVSGIRNARQADELKKAFGKDQE